MKHLSTPFIPIPKDQLKYMKGRCVHTNWQQVAGMRWILKEIDGDRVRIETQKTQKSLWTDASSLCYTRNNEPKNDKS